MSDTYTPVDASVVPEAVGVEKARDRMHAERMYAEETSLNTVVFRNADDSRTLYMFDYPVKYVTADGTTADISLDIVQSATAPGAFETAANSIQAEFSRSLSDGIHLAGEGVSVTLTPILPQVGTASGGNMHIQADSVATLINQKTVSYPYGTNTSLEYSLTYNGFKEDIVVSEYTGQTEYPFILKTNGLTLTKLYESYYLTDANGEIKAALGDIVIFTADERNNTFGSLSYTTLRENQEYLIVIRVDAEYLQDENTAYPIRIDPTIEICYDNNGGGAIEDVTLYELDNESDGSSGTIFVGKRDTFGASRLLMRFPGLNLSGIASADRITNAFVELRDLMCEAEALTVSCHVFTGNNWTEANTGWNDANANSHLPAALSSNTVSYTNGITQAEYHTYAFDITAAVRGWKAGNYNQSKGIIFRSSNAVEDGSVSLRKAFGSYNRTAYRPTLTVTYSTTGTQTVPDGDYYLNNYERGSYISYNPGEGLKQETGYVSTLGYSTRWETRKVSGGYIIRSKQSPTSYLSASALSESSAVTIVTIVEGNIPARAIWNITLAEGGCRIQNTATSKYLASTTTDVLTTVDSPGASGTEQNRLTAWRVAAPSLVQGRELTPGYKINLAQIPAVGGTTTATVRPSPTDAIWCAPGDFTYEIIVSSRISNNRGTFTALSEGVTTVIATHKITNEATVFAVVVGTRPQMAIMNYRDQGHLLRYDDTVLNLPVLVSEVAAVLEQYFGLQITIQHSTITSVLDTCKIDTYGSVTAGNLNAQCDHEALCLHFNTDEFLGMDTDFTDHIVMDFMSDVEFAGTKVLWTGHIPHGYTNSYSSVGEGSVIMTPYLTVDSNYSLFDADEIERVYQRALLHELSHQLYAPDQYCYNSSGETSQCSNENCEICVDKKPSQCIMGYFYDYGYVKNWSTTSYYCDECLLTVCNSIDVYF